LKYELCTELVHFKMCELNFELVHVTLDHVGSCDTEDWINEVEQKT